MQYLATRTAKQVHGEFANEASIFGDLYELGGLDVPPLGMLPSREHLISRWFWINWGEPMSQRQ